MVDCNGCLQCLRTIPRQSGMFSPQNAAPVVSRLALGFPFLSLTPIFCFCFGCASHVTSALHLTQRLTKKNDGTISHLGQIDHDLPVDHLPFTTVYITRTHLGRFSKPDCSTTKRVPVPTLNDTSSESSRRDVSCADQFGTGTIPTVEIPSTENRPRRM